MGKTKYVEAAPIPQQDLPPPPAPVAAMAQQVDTRGQQRAVREAQQERQGRRATVLTKRKPKVSKLGQNTKGTTSMLGQPR